MSGISDTLSGSTGQTVRLFGHQRRSTMHFCVVAAGIEVAPLQLMRHSQPPPFSRSAYRVFFYLGLILGLACSGTPRVPTTPSSIASGPLVLSIDLPGNFNHCQTASPNPQFVFRTHGLAKLTNFIEKSELPSPRKPTPTVRAYVRSRTPTIVPPSRVCLDAALDLALHALSTDQSEASPRTAVFMREQRDALGCDIRCWFNRESAVVALLSTDERRWPRPSELTIKQLTRSVSSWVFFLSSPDLSESWTWIAVPKNAPESGTVRVRVWNER